MKKKITNALSLLVAITLVTLLFCSCGSTSTESTTKSAGNAYESDNTSENTKIATETISNETFRVVLDTEPTGLYPQFGNMVQSTITIAHCLFEQLVYWDTAQDALIPGLAESWENIDDLHWRLHIREGVIAEDGTPFTANDVYYSFKVGCEGTDVSSYSRIFNMDEFEVEDDYTIVIATNSCNPKLMESLTKSAYAMLSESSVENSGGLESQQLNPHCGTGKYILDEYASGQYIRLVRNENYWNQNDLGYFASIEFTFVSDAATRLMSLQSGEADYVNSLIATQIFGLLDSTEINALATETPGAEVIVFNCAVEPFNNELVREAVFYLVDPEECALLVTNGMSSVTNSMLGTTNSYYTEPENYSREVDVEKAKEILTEAGYPNGLTIDIQYTGSSTVYEIVQNQLSKGGITLNLIPVEYATLKVAQRTGEYQMVITSLKVADIMQTFQTIDARVGYAMNAGGCQCSDEEVYEILDNVYYEFDEDAAINYYYELQDYVREHNIIIGLYNTMTYNAISSDFTTPIFDLAGSVDISSVRRAN